jgi:hypothetical protein
VSGNAARSLVKRIHIPLVGVELLSTASIDSFKTRAKYRMSFGKKLSTL